MIQIKLNLKTIFILTTIVAILLGLFLVTAANLPDITISTPGNNTYLDSATPSFNFTIVGANASYNVELIIDGGYYGNATYLSGAQQRITANATVPNGMAIWYLNVSNNTDVNTTGRFYVTLDTTDPVPSFGDTTCADGVYIQLNNITVNVSVAGSEQNPVNITFFLYNSTSLYNSTFKGMSNLLSNNTINWTDLPDGAYTFNATVVDQVNRRNSTGSRTYYIDTTVPVTVYAATTPANNSNVSLIWIDASVTESNPAIINFTLTNSTDQYNLTSKNMASSTSNTTIIWDNLAEGTYTFNYTVLDMPGFGNSSITRTVVVDTTAPTLDVESPINLTEDTDGSVTFRYSTTDANTLANCTLYTSSVLNATNSSLTYNNTNSTFVVLQMNQSDALEWYITCSDAAGNMNTSATYTIDTLAAAATESTTTTTDGSTAASLSDDDEEETEETSDESSITVEVEEEEEEEEPECVISRDCIDIDPTRAYKCVMGECKDIGRHLGKKPPGPARAAGEEGVFDTIKSWFVDEGTGDPWVDQGFSEYSSLAEEEAFLFDFTSIEGEEEEHTLTVLDVNTDEQVVTLMLESEPKELTMSVGVPTYVDIDEDGTADLEINLNSISEDGLIDLTFQKLDGWHGFEPVKNNTWAWWIVGILALLVIIGLIGYWIKSR